MKKHLIALVSVILAVCLIIGSAEAASSVQTSSTGVDAAAVGGVTRTRNIINGNSYNRYNSVVRSYLEPCTDGWMRIYGSDNGTLLAEYYDRNYRFVSNRTVECGLPLFGGFYACGGLYYVLTGDLNPNEDDGKEVFRITCFDTTWKKLGGDSIYGANTTVPFDAGRASFAVYGDLLFIRSCHEIYEIDGINHQTNLTIVFDMKKRVFKDYFTDVASIKSAGFLSHSFNQFVAVDTNGTVVCLDHGDSHTRDAALGRFTTTANSFVIRKAGYQTYEYTPIISYYGRQGDNYTAAMVGGLAISSTSYLTVGTCAGQNENYRTNHAYNAYLSVTDKTVKELENAQTTLTYFTSFTEESGRYASNPHLVKVNDNLFLVMWNEFPVSHNNYVIDIPIEYNENHLMKYVFVNGKGESVTDVMTAPVNRGIFVSECEPVVRDNRIFWFVSDADRINSIIEMDLSGNITVHEHVIPEDYFIYPIDLSKATVALRSFDRIPDTVSITEDNIDDYVVVCYKGVPLERGKDYHLSATSPISLGKSQGYIRGIQLRLSTVADYSYFPLSYAANWSVTDNSLYLNGAVREDDGIHLSVIARRGIGYHVYRRELGSNDDYELVATVADKLTDTYVDTTARRSKGYTYIIREFTYDRNGEEVLSPPSSARSVAPGEGEDPTEPETQPGTQPSEEPPTDPSTEPVPYAVLGDSDRDGKVSVLDATRIQRYLAGLIHEDQIDVIAADVDDDNKVSILDATAIQRFLAGINTNLPIGRQFYVVYH